MNRLREVVNESGFTWHSKLLSSYIADVFRSDSIDTQPACFKNFLDFNAQHSYSFLLTCLITMGGSPGELSEELVTYEKQKKGWRMNCDVGEVT